ncbi:MAG: hypothetical protein NC231_12795 [Bacillus sp. (in: Bacteria)]|nr:hypothetical protein [Bacillus sp. (in: firmicutes)]MCM1426703.1 hypothetical protein [Eubacterium sp.]
MNGKKTYCFYEEDFPFFVSWWDGIIDDTMAVEAPNQYRDWSCVGISGAFGFYNVHCIEYKTGYALQTSLALQGNGGSSDLIGNASFLIVWDENGDAHVDKWWVELWK